MASSSTFISSLLSLLGFSTFQIIAGYILLCAAFMYVVIMGPSKFHRDGCVGGLHRWMMRCPAFCGTCVCFLFCCCCRLTKAQRAWHQFEDRVMHKKHPGMVIFYVVVIGTAEYFYLSGAVPKLLSFERRAFAWLLIIASEISFIVACMADPGVVTPAHLQDTQARAFAPENAKFVDPNESKMKRKLKRAFLLSPEEERAQSRRYVVDNILYAIAPQQRHPACPIEKVPPPPHGVPCTTCEAPRPSRSKHCRLCGHCVRRFDHHCPWINNDVAENNHRYFLLFLFSHIVSCYWATYDCATILLDIVRGQRLLTAMFVNGAGRRVRATTTHIALHLMNQETVVCCVMLFTVLIGTLLVGFWGYQMRMVLLNVTSNDLNKIDDVIEFLQRQPTASDLHREATQLAQTMFQWTGRRVAIPPLPEPLREAIPRVQALGEDASVRAAAMATAVPLTEEQKKLSRKFRKDVERVIASALKRTFCTGTYAGNLREVLFPYRESKYHCQWKNELAPGASRKEKLFGAYRSGEDTAYAKTVNAQRPLPGESLASATRNDPKLAASKKGKGRR